MHAQQYISSWFHLVQDKIEHDWDFQHNIDNNTQTLYITHVLALQSCIQFVKYSTSFFQYQKFIASIQNAYQEKNP